MATFKALLLPALVMIARAAPTEVVAGRVVTHAVPSLTSLRASPLLHQVRAVPAFHAVPATHVVHGATADDVGANEVVAGRVVAQAFPSLPSLHSSPFLHPVRAVPAFHAVPATQVIQGGPADDADATEVVAARDVPQAFPSLTSLSSSPLFPQVRAVPAVNAVNAVNTVPAVRAIPTVDDSHVIIPSVAQDSFDVHPQYSFGYSISDSVTGDSKSRQESRDGDAVSGSYSVADPDGRIRTVTYTADDVHGFQATVTYDGEEGPVAIPFNAPAASFNTVVAPQQITAAVQPVDDIENDDNVENANNDSLGVTAARTTSNPATNPTVPVFNHLRTAFPVHPSFNAVNTLPTIRAFQHQPLQHFFHPATPSVVRTGHGISRLHFLP